MRITAKGEIKIPRRLQHIHGLLPNTPIELVSDGDELRIVRREHRAEKGKEIVNNLRGKGDVRLTTEQIMKLTRG